jgi:peptide subunit release factor 1 (eRF1)
MSDATDRTVDHELRERIETIGDLKGRGSDLLTLSVRPDQSLGTVLEEVEEDHAEIEYIEEDTRQFRRDALENLRRILREYESTPDQGLIVYTGVVDDELIEYVFDDLPEPVGTAVYRAANDFSTEPLESIAGSAATYGLLVLERGRAVLGAVAGGRNCFGSWPRRWRANTPPTASRTTNTKTSASARKRTSSKPLPRKRPGSSSARIQSIGYCWAGRR